MRYLPLGDAERAQMLAKIGVDHVDDLFADVPEQARLSGPVDLPRHMGELEVERKLSALAARNVTAGSVPFFIGAGAYRHHVPATVDHIIQRSEFLTSYTPYQPEVSQGTTQYLFEFQTQVARITGMDVANASMYDGSTGCAEAVLMAQRVTKKAKAILSGGLHPHYRAVVQNMDRLMGEPSTVLPADVTGVEDIAAHIDDDTACVVVQSPNVFGHLVDLRPIAEAAHAKGVLLVAVCTEVVALGAIESPGEQGADIVVAEGQSIGNSLNFGGPYVGLFATRQKYVRQMPGRLSGRTVDANGREGYVLTLSTREQHIRRDKATSNICTNSGLCCLAFTVHMSLLGEKGFGRLAALNHQAAVRLAGALGRVPGVNLITPYFFNEFTLSVKGRAADVVDRLAEKGVLGGVPASRLWPDRPEMDSLLIVAATETNTPEDQAAFVTALEEVLQ